MVLIWKENAGLINMNRIKPVQQVEGAKRAKADAGAKTDDGMVTVILKLELHCEGCAKKAERAMKQYQGVEDVKADCGANKVTVTGKVDAVKLKESLEEQMKKKVDIISHQSKKYISAGGGDIKSKKKPAEEKKADKKLLKEQEEETKRAKADTGAKTDDGMVTVILKLDFHCEGCAKKAERAMKEYQGVEDVKTDCGANKVTVTGKVDPVKLKESLEEQMKKKVDLISPKSKKYVGAGGGNIKSKKKPVEEKKADKKLPKERTIVLKIRSDCESCISNIRKTIQNFKGVAKVTIEGGSDLVTVKGTMDVKELVPYLKGKLKRNVGVVLPMKENREGKRGGGG